MLEDFSASISDKYFISIGKQKHHSFIMLGVVVDNKRRLLARVAKRFTAHHQRTPCTEPFLMTFSNIETTFSHESIEFNDSTRISDITQTSYAITYEQTKRFLDYLRAINIQQCINRATNDQIDQCNSIYLTDLPAGSLLNAVSFDAGYIRVLNTQKQINKLFYINKQQKIAIDLKLNEEKLNVYDGIIQNHSNSNVLIDSNDLKKIAPIVLSYDLMKMYLPIKKDNTENISFVYCTLKPSVSEFNNDNLKDDPLREDMHAIGRGKPDCRETAIRMVKKVRETEEELYNVSDKFYKDLSIPTKLVGGKFTDEEPDYILPLPPTAFKPESTDIARTQQQVLLKKLYRRMEELVTLEPNSAKTLAKFKKLRDLYEQQAGTSYNDPEDILTAIISWRYKEENRHVFELRKTYFFDWFITRKSTTEKMFDEFEGMASPPKTSP